VQTLFSAPDDLLATSVVHPRLRSAVFDQQAISNELAAQARLFNAKREEADTDWAEVERIDYQELAAMDELVSRVTAGLTADNYANSLEALF
jgi:hypothetical protein